MALLTTTALDRLKKYIKRTVNYAKYKMNGNYVKVPLTDIQIDSSGVIRITFMIEPGGSNAQVTEVQLYDMDNQLWLSKSTNISMSSVEEGYLELIKITITDKEVTDA